MGEITQTDFGYTFQRGLPGTGLMDYRARFYAPALGRFIQPDSIVPGPENPQAWNRYTYVSNLPINRKDPSGHWEDEGCGSGELCELPPEEDDDEGKTDSLRGSDFTLETLSLLADYLEKKPRLEFGILLPRELDSSYAQYTLRVNPSFMSVLSKALTIVGILTQVGPAQIQNFEEGMENNKTWIEYKNDIKADLIIDMTIWGVSTLIGFGVFAFLTGETVGIGVIPAAALGAAATVGVQSILNNQVNNSTLRSDLARFLIDFENVMALQPQPPSVIPIPVPNPPSRPFETPFPGY